MESLHQRLGEIRGDASVVRAPFPYEMKAERNGQIIVKKCPRTVALNFLCSGDVS